MRVGQPGRTDWPGKRKKMSMVEVDLEGDDIIMNDEVVGLYS